MSSKSIQLNPNASLYQAQSASIDVMNSSWFPCYTPEHIQSQEGLKGKLLWCYGKGYDAVSFLNPLATATNYVASKLLKAGDFVLGWAIRPIADAVFPINPVNGQRHFVGIPRSVEKFLGDWIFYPLITSGMRESNELLPNTNERIGEKVDHVFKRLLKANTELLNPKGETEFDYRVKTIHSSDVNAFAVPAGGMVVFTQLVKEIDGAIKSKKIKESTVQFADGSTATVDLTNVTLEDTIASLMGHEMTHAASRHSIVALVGQFLRTVLLSIGRFALVTYLKSIDKEYSALSNKANLQEHEKRTLEEKEELYSKLNGVFRWVEEQISKLTSLFNSRKNEYEADATGAYFAAQANFNPLGAIYLQEVLKDSKGGLADLLHKHFEFAFTHPYVENRKRAVFAAIQGMQPQALKGRVQLKIANNGYDFNRSDKAIQYAKKLMLQ